MQESSCSSDTLLLEGLAAIACVARSLYGPGKARKQVTDALGATRFTSDAFEIVQALSSEHAVLAIMNEALEQQMRSHGTRCTTLLNLCNVLAQAAIDLKRQSVPTDVIRAALNRAEKICLKTLKSMRLTLAEAVDGWEEAASREIQLRLLGERLQTRTTGDALQRIAVSVPMQLALEIMLGTPSSLITNPEFDLENVLTTRIVLGGTSFSEQDTGEHSSSRVVSGALLPIETEYCVMIRSSFAPRAPNSRDSPVVLNGVVAINGDFSYSDLCAARHPSDFGIERVRIVFVHGEVDSQAMDRSWKQRTSLEQAADCRCIPVESYKELACIAELCGAQIIDSWSEVLPFAVGFDPVELQLVEISGTSLGGVDAYAEGDDDVDSDDGDCHRIGTRSHAKLFLRVARADPSRSSSLPIMTLLARGSMQSMAAELQQNVRKSWRRVANALRCGYLLPSGGAFLCACAAEIRAELARRNSSKRTNEKSFEDSLMDAAMERTIEALSRLSVLLLQNTGQGASDLRGGGDSNSFFACLARVREVQANYLEGIQDGRCTIPNDHDDDIRTKFYATCYFGGSDFSVLPKRTDENHRLDDYSSVKAAFRRSFRLVDLALSIAAYQINLSDQQ